MPAAIDRQIDVWFMSVGEQLAVEVKSRRSKMPDIERGIFQCVKYRALLKAQSQVARFSTKQNIRVLLVSEQPAPGLTWQQLPEEARETVTRLMARLFSGHESGDRRSRPPGGRRDV